MEIQPEIPLPAQDKNVVHPRDALGRLLPGQPQSLNPYGRPKGRSLKEYWRYRFSQMSDKEKLEFTANVHPEIIWRMAEGNPHQSGDASLNVIIPKPIDDVLPDISIQKNQIAAPKDTGGTGGNESKQDSLDHTLADSPSPK